MLDDNHLFQRAAAASSAYASMAAFTAAANMYNSFYPNSSTTCDPVNYFACSGQFLSPISQGFTPLLLR